MGFQYVVIYRAVSFTTCQVSIYLGTPSPLGRCCRDRNFSPDQIKMWCQLKQN